MLPRLINLSALVLSGVLATTSRAEVDPARLYAIHCAACHGADRLGGSGPALVPETLDRLPPQAVAQVIADGRVATQMPGFAHLLSSAAIEALAAYLFTPPATRPRWEIEAIEASRQILIADQELPDKPVYDADPLNLFVLVETGDHHISIRDGDRFRRLARLPTHRALHGGPKFSPDGRFVWTASRDGWIERFDLWSLQKLGEVRVGINTRNIAISADGQVLAVANWLPRTFVLLDAQTLRPLKVEEVRDRRNRASSRISAVYQAPDRQAFVAALKDAAEVWEIAWRHPLFERLQGRAAGLAESEAAALDPAQPLPIRRIELDEPVDDFFFDPSYRFLLGASRRSDRAVVVHLDVGRVIASLPLAGMPHLGSGIAFTWQGRRVVATPHLREAAISIIDLQSFEVVKRIPTLGPAFFIRSHERSPHIWADASLGPQRDIMQVIDKNTLEIIATKQPEPGKTAMHAEFDRHGRYVLVSVADAQGAVVVYDDRSLAEVARLPAAKPSGKYNVWNKITFSAGTSH